MTHLTGGHRASDTPDRGTQRDKDTSQVGPGTPADRHKAARSSGGQPVLLLLVGHQVVLGVVLLPALFTPQHVARVQPHVALQAVAAVHAVVAHVAPESLAGIVTGGGGGGGGGPKVGAVKGLSEREEVRVWRRPYSTQRLVYLTGPGP